jgi:hypothetical protein
MTAFHPFFRGWVDDANPRWIRGWVINKRAPTEPVEAQLYIDGRFIESQPAAHARLDIVASQLAENEKHGFFFSTPPLEQGEHEARVYAVHESGAGARRTMQLVGQPFRCVVESNPAEPYFRGSVDEANMRYVKGWITSVAGPSANVEVQLYIDGHYVESRVANQPRPDIIAAHLAEDENHGFFFMAPPLAAGEHEACVYVIQESDHGRILRLIEKPVRFTVNAAAPPVPDDANVLKASP